MSLGLKATLGVVLVVIAVLVVALIMCGALFRRRVTGALSRLAGHCANIRDLEAPVTSEGVENAEQLDLLKKLGSDYGQGYYFGKPLTNEATTRLLERDPTW